MTEKTRETYSVVVESGSYSYQNGRTRYEEREHCGHNHKTIETAEKCMDKLTRWYCIHERVAGTLCGACGYLAQSDRTYSKWYNATIHNQHEQRVAVL